MENNVPTTRDLILENEFGWLKDYDVSTIDGKKMLKPKGSVVPINVATILEKKVFDYKWVMQFALGNYNGVNYFNLREWLELSDQGLLSVMVVDDNHNPLIIIPPLMSTNLGPEQYKMFRNIELAIKQLSADNITANNPMASANLATMSNNSLEKVKRRTYTDMVPDWYYEKLNIVPTVEQQVFYLRDNINNGVLTAEEMDKSRTIFYNLHKGEKVSSEDKEFINKLAKGQFEGFNKEKTNENNEGGETPSEEGYDPLEC